MNHLWGSPDLARILRGLPIRPWDKEQLWNHRLVKALFPTSLSRRPAALFYATRLPFFIFTPLNLLQKLSPLPLGFLGTSEFVKSFACWVPFALLGLCLILLSNPVLSQLQE